MGRLSKRFLLAGCLLTIALASALLLRSRCKTSISPDVMAGNALAFRLFSAAAARNPNENIAIQPIALRAMLTALYDGASDEARRSFPKALAPSVNAPEDPESTRAYVSPPSQSWWANGVWLEGKTSVTPQFKETALKCYNLDLLRLPDSPPDLASTMNRWVSTKTHGRIQAVPAGSGPGLLSVSFFHPEWDTSFDKTRTCESGSYDGNGHPVMRTMMTRMTGRYLHLEGKDFRAVALGCVGGQQTVYIFMPKNRESTDSFCSRLGDREWRRLTNRFRPGNPGSAMTMPRFRLSSQIDLTPVLKDLGVRSIANGQSSALPDIGLGNRLDWLKSITVIDIDEGTTPYRPTVRTAVPGIYPITEPFVFIVQDNASGRVLLMGRVLDPQP